MEFSIGHSSSRVHEKELGLWNSTDLGSNTSFATDQLYQTRSHQQVESQCSLLTGQLGELAELMRMCMMCLTHRRYSVNSSDFYEPDLPTPRPVFFSVPPYEDPEPFQEAHLGLGLTSLHSSQVQASITHTSFFLVEV